MKKLLLMRHAKSSWKDSDIPDHKRPLKKRGVKDSLRMGKLLKSKKLVPDIILSSTAERSKMTAKLLAKSSKYKGKIQYLDTLYMAEPSNILKAIQKYGKDSDVVVLVGHNPGMEAFVQILTGKVECLPTASIAYITAKIDNWKDLAEEDKAKLKKLWRPKDIK